MWPSPPSYLPASRLTPQKAAMQLQSERQVADAKDSFVILREGN
jgi:hypothetical protein